MDYQDLDQRTPIRRILDRVELCVEVIQEAHLELEQPTDPDEKADLLIAVEALTYEVLDLLQTTKTYVWGPESNPEEDE